LGLVALTTGLLAPAPPLTTIAPLSGLSVSMPVKLTDLRLPKLQLPE
jgi:hypothetical protein